MKSKRQHNDSLKFCFIGYYGIVITTVIMLIIN
jgi:hypothetical protein